MTESTTDYFDQLLDEQTGNRKTVPICMKRHLRHEYEQVAEDIKALRGSGSSARRLAESGADGPEVKALVAKLADLEKQVEAATVPFIVIEIDRRDWQKLILRHPPRKGEDGDRAMGVNLASFMEEAIPACVSEPSLTPERWEKLQLSSHDYDRLLAAVWDMNRGGADLPKLPPALRGMIEGSDD